MSDPSKDIHIASNLNIPVAMVPTKPCYLVKMLPEGKTAKSKLFVAVELPKFDTAFIQVKGFFFDGEESDIVTNYTVRIAEADKNTFVEMWFPVHSIANIRSLIFKVNKAK